MKKTRDPKFELLRITSMLLIIIWHILLYAGVMDHATSNVAYLLWLIKAICAVHVNSFILVTGYYQCKSKLNPKKIFGIINMSWFYRVVITLIVLYLGLMPFPTIELIRNFLPYQSSAYWFINCYIILYLLSPFLNKLLDHLSQKEHKGLIALLIFLVSIMVNISNQRFFNNNYGFSPVTFVLMYIIGAYFRNYPLEENKVLKGNTRRKNQCIFIGGFILAFSFNYLIKIFCMTILTTNGSVITYIREVLESMIYNYDNPIVIFQSIMYFGYFSTLRIKNKVLTKCINKISSFVLGIYMIHESLYFRYFAYSYLGFTKGTIYNSCKVIFPICKVTVEIFVICSIIEYARQLLFSLVKRTKISKRFRNMLIAYWNSLDIYPLKPVE